jgi:hypothetical protein
MNPQRMVREEIAEEFFFIPAGLGVNFVPTTVEQNGAETSAKR